ncbi:serine hydrolase domain-containing protein [Mucilaginibacter ximonensis]|uniref:Serine hydrolase domain-containing protein n=1 Tax=Mucilaginibacter ximonensis TaxID=538021 RepID=A0ABW5Y8Z6_9SPHI
MSANSKNNIDISNWQQWPNNTWAFQHVDKILPTVIVNSNAKGHSAFDQGEKFIDDPQFNHFISETETDSILVLHHGHIVHEQYFKGNNKDTRHILMSATKAVMGLLAGILAQREMINLDKTVETYIPELKETAYGNVTLRYLLDMRIGFTLDEDQQKLYAEASNWDQARDVNERISLHEFYGKLKEVKDNGNDTFKYISANTDLLGWAIERATETPINVLLSEMIWKPIGARHDAYLTVDSKGSPRCTGGFCATLRDFALLGQSLLGDGRLSSSILPHAVVDDIYKNGDTRAWRDGEWGKAFAAISSDMAYRSGWYVINSKPKLILAMGIYGQNLFVDPVNEIVVAKFSSWKEQLDYSAVFKTHQLVARAVTLLSGQEK